MDLYTWSSIHASGTIHNIVLSNRENGKRNWTEGGNYMSILDVVHVRCGVNDNKDELSDIVRS